MPTVPWATPVQIVFLESRRGDFSKAQESKMLPSFWIEIKNEFFTRWPDRTAEAESQNDEIPEGTSNKKSSKKRSKTGVIVTSAPEISHEAWVALRKTQIHTWFNNHGLNRGRRSGKLETVKIEMPSSSTRLSTEQHIYSKKYYDTRVKDAVEAELGDGVVEPSKRLAIVNRITAEIFKSESAEIKEEVRMLQEEERKAKEAAKELDTLIRDGNSTKTPEAYMLAQSTLPLVIRNFCEAMADRTGWAFTVLAGGPDMAKEGEIRSVGIHIGQDRYGNSFGKATPNFTDTILKPFSGFLHSVYSESKNAPAFTPSPRATEKQVEESTSVHATGLTAGAPAPAITPAMSPMVHVGGTTSDSVPATALTAAAPAPVIAPAYPITPAMSPMVPFGGMVAPSAPFVSTSDIEPIRSGMAPTMGTPMYQMNNVPFTQLSLPNLQTWGGSFAPNFDFEGRQGSMTGVNPHYASPYTNGGNEGWSFLEQLMDPQIINMGSGNPGTANAYGGMPIGNMCPPGGMTELPRMAMEAQSLDVPTNIDQTSPLSNRTSVASVIEPTSVPALGESLGTRVRKPATSKEVISLTAMKETEDLPMWMKAALDHLNDGVAVKEWSECLNAWMAFEKENGMLDVSSYRLGTKGRPPILSKWITKRNYQCIPEIEDMGKYIMEWHDWWMGLQPEWRWVEKTGCLPLPLTSAEPNEDFANLKKGGPSGFVVLLIGLKWWACSERRDQWLAALADVKACLDRLSPASTGQKRKAEGGHRGKGKRKRV